MFAAVCHSPAKAPTWLFKATSLPWLPAASVDTPLLGCHQNAKGPYLAFQWLLRLVVAS